MTTHLNTRHRGTVPDDQIAGGSATSGKVPISNGDGTRTWSAIPVPDAADIPITDSGAYFSNTDVEGALQELGAGLGGGGGIDLSALAIEPVLQAVSDYVAGYDASAADERGFPIGALRIGRGHTVIASECYVNANTDVMEGGVIMQASGTGAQVQPASSQTSHPGVLLLSMGTTTTGRATVVLNNLNNVAVGEGKLRFGVVTKIVTLSDGTDRFTVRQGISNSSVADGTNAVMFRYADNVNGGKWQAVCRTSSTETATDTGITADTNWHTYEWEANAAGTSIEFFIDGTSVATVATNVPGGTRMTFLPLNAIKSLGTTNRTINIDAYWYIFEFTTAR